MYQTRRRSHRRPDRNETDPSHRVTTDHKVEHPKSSSEQKSYTPNEEILPHPIKEIDVSGDSSATTKQQQSQQQSHQRILKKGSVTIVHGSMTGTCAKFAKQLYEALEGKNWVEKEILRLESTENFDWWDELINDEGEEEEVEKKNLTCQHTNQSHQPALLILLLPTYTDGTWPPVASTLETALQELNTDWRIAKHPLKGKLQVAVFGTGSSEYIDALNGINNMGKPAKEALRYFQKLGAKCRGKIMVGDDAVGNHAQDTFARWQEQLFRQLEKANGCACQEKGNRSALSGGKSTATSKGICQARSDTPVDTIAETTPEEYETDEDDDEDQREPEIIDLEDMGDAVLAASLSGKNSSSEPREMVTPSQSAALKKEGYRLIGTHSAVKLCRWTKHQLRGRGGCYKHTFYGITSYQCMEATPSLACANKCVFCWRHHKNPVGKEWRWKTDDPHFIVDQAVEAHVQMIKETKGIPGVQMDRWKEALTPRHCALSLVGEPIMYPRIDEFLEDLHTRKISTFLVTNGQHPVAIGNLRPVTQLYVSVDAPNQKSLIEIDRPLFSDAWDRLKQSLTSLKDKGQRTVARLTVVKGWNSDDIEGYAKLIALGKVSLVEVKGVTYCGKSDASNLNMSNTPWHHEVVDLTRKLKEEIDKMRQQGGNDVSPEYDFACEHKHSCSVLLARVDQFAVDDQITGDRKWRTWIDYDKFHELAARHAEDSTFKFSVEDYTAETPVWALFGSDEEGFDPTDMRHRPKNKIPKYTKFDENGIPTHNHKNEELSDSEREQLVAMMEQRKREVGSGSTITELKGGAKEIVDASLMYRGLTITA